MYYRDTRNLYRTYVGQETVTPLNFVTFKKLKGEKFSTPYTGKVNFDPFQNSNETVSLTSPSLRPPVIFRRRIKRTLLVKT